MSLCESDAETCDRKHVSIRPVSVADALPSAQSQHVRTRPRKRNQLAPSLCWFLSYYTSIGIGIGIGWIVSYVMV